MIRYLSFLAVVQLWLIQPAQADSLSQALQLQEGSLREAARAVAPTAQLGGSQFIHALSNQLSVGGAQLAPATDKLTLVQQDPRFVENARLLYGLQQTPAGVIPGPQDPSRIWGGLSTTNYNSVVALIIKGDDTGLKLCTGIAVSPNTVLTAAHCVCATVTDVYEGFSIFTPVYAHKPIPKSGLASQMRGCNAPRSVAADIGLVQITDQFKYTNPVILASSETINNLDVLRAVGFGETETRQVGQKKYVDIPVASPDCSHLTNLPTGTIVRDQDFYGCSAGFELVAGQSHLNHDTCHGDSGGPVFGYVAKGGGAFDEYLVGITSRGISGADNPTDCGQGGIYTRVDGPTLTYLRSQHVNVVVQ